jgi:hypothetical protein
MDQRHFWIIKIGFECLKIGFWNPFLDDTTAKMDHHFGSSSKVKLSQQSPGRGLWLLSLDAELRRRQLSNVRGWGLWWVYMHKVGYNCGYIYIYNIYIYILLLLFIIIIYYYYYLLLLLAYIYILYTCNWPQSTVSKWLTSQQKFGATVLELLQCGQHLLIPAHFW